MRDAVVIREGGEQQLGLRARSSGLRSHGQQRADGWEQIQAAIRLHTAGLRADGLEVPPPTSIGEPVDT